MDSIEKKMERMIREGGEGKVYFPDDFFECGSDKGISKALQRLVARGVLMRMSRGLYCSPIEDRHWGMGKLMAGADSVLEKYKYRDGFRTALCGCAAQNALGLSEQVVMNPVFSTDGPSRRIHYRDGLRPIILEHVSPRIFNYKSRIVMLTVLALEDIGPKDLWEFDTERMEEIYAEIPYEEIREDLKSTPRWIRDIILQIKGMSNKKFNKYDGRVQRHAS